MLAIIVAGLRKKNVKTSLNTRLPGAHKNTQLSPNLPPIPKSSLLAGKNAQERKEYPIYEGVFGYFRDALVRVAGVSWAGNNQHNPGQPLHWARGKSTDQMDCILRHAAEVDLDDMSDETEQHLGSLAWRSLAALQIYLEKKYNIEPPVNARTDE